MSDYSVKIGIDAEVAKLNQIEQQINTLCNNQHQVKITLDDSKITSQIQAIEDQIQRLNNINLAPGSGGGNGRSRGSRGSNPVTEAYRDIVKIQREINQNNIKMSKLTPGKDSLQISELRRQARTLQQEYDNIFSQFGTRFTQKQTDALDRMVRTTNEKIRTMQMGNIDKGYLNGQAEAYERILSLAKQVQAAELDYAKNQASGKTNLANNVANNLGDLRSQLNTVRQEYDSFFGSLTSEQNKQIGDLTERMFNETRTSLDKQLREIEASSRDASAKIVSGIQDKIDSGALESKLNTVKLKFKELGVESQTVTDNISKMEQLLTGMNGNKDVNSMTSSYKEFNKLLNQTNDLVKNLKAEQKQLNNESANNNGFVSGLKSVAAQYFSTYAIIHTGIRTLKDMYNNVLSVDTAMTELYRVTSLSDKEYAVLYDNMTKSAKEYGIALNTMINSTASWVRLGFDANTANKLAEVSTMYQNVTDLDESTAVKNLVTAYQGYKEQLTKVYNGNEVAAVEHIADVYDKLGNEFPVTAANVGEAMTKCASVMMEAGASFEETSGMITGGGSVTQNFEQTGTALKIATLRIRGMKGELQELGEEVDDNVVSVSKMQTEILNLTKGKVNIFEDDGKSFRNIYDIFRDIANILPELDDANRSKLLETIAGKNRSNSILAMLQNWNQVEAATKAANNSAGTAQKENEIFMNSLQGKLNTLKASWQEFSNAFMSSDFLKFGVDSLTGIVDVVTQLTKSFGALGTVAAGAGIAKVIKSLS